MKTDQEIAEEAAQSIASTAAGEDFGQHEAEDIILAAITQAKAGLVKKFEDVFGPGSSGLDYAGSIAAQIERIQGERDQLKTELRAIRETPSGIYFVEIKSERDQLRAEVVRLRDRDVEEWRKAREEITELRAQLAGMTEERDRWKEWADPEKTSFKVQKLVQRAEKAEKACAEKDETLRDVRRFLPTHGTWADGGIDKYEKALSSSAGQDYVHKSEVEKANQSGEEWMGKASDLSRELYDTKKQLRKAAKTANSPPTSPKPQARRV